MNLKNKIERREKATLALKNALKKLGDKRVREIIQEVTALDIRGPKMDEYFKEVESHYPALLDSNYFNKLQKDNVVEVADLLYSGPIQTNISKVDLESHASTYINLKDVFVDYLQGQMISWFCGGNNFVSYSTINKYHEYPSLMHKRAAPQVLTPPPKFFNDLQTQNLFITTALSSGLLF